VVVVDRNDFDLLTHTQPVEGEIDLLRRDDTVPVAVLLVTSKHLVYLL
jgi:hypothetical protein